MTRGRSLFIYMIVMFFLFINRLNSQTKPNNFNHAGVDYVFIEYVDFLSSEKTTSESKYCSYNTILKIDNHAKKYIKRKTRNKQVHGPGNNCPVIIDEWKNYVRQIYLYNDQRLGSEVILINYIHVNMLIDHQKWRTEYIKTYGGCSNYWQIKYDLKKKRFLDFVIN